MTTFRYQDRCQGRGVVVDFRRLLTTGDVEKITPRLWRALIQHGGFIAHYDLHGFRTTYRDRLTELLQGECYSLTDPECWARKGYLKESGYADGWSARDVMHAIATVGAELAPMVRAREQTRRDTDEIVLATQLAERHGYKLVQA